MRLALQDAMGHSTADVYEFCRRHRAKIFPTQGKDMLAQPFAWSNLEYYPGGKKSIPGGLKLIRFDSNYFKNDLSNRFAFDIPAAPADLSLCKSRSLCVFGDYVICACYPSSGPPHLWSDS